MVRATSRLLWLTLLVGVFSLACLTESSTKVSPTPSPIIQIIEVTPIPPIPEQWVCLKGKFQVTDELGTNWLIGERLICAPEWKISNLYGPDFNSIGDKPIYFSDFTPKE